VQKDLGFFCFAVFLMAPFFSGCTPLYAHKKYFPIEKPENSMSIFNNLEKALSEGWLGDPQFYNERTLLDFLGGECVYWAVSEPAYKSGRIGDYVDKRCASTPVAAKLDDRKNFSVLKGYAQICVSLLTQDVTFSRIKDRFGSKWLPQTNLQIQALLGRVYTLPFKASKGRSKSMVFYFDKEFNPLQTCVFDTEI